MPIEVVKERDANIIYYPPIVDDTYRDQITIGDLYGNFMKLIYMLAKHGIAESSTEYYNSLAGIYLANNLSDQKSIERFNTILKNIQFRTDTKIRLIGNELASEGVNDYCTLKLLEQLQKKGVPIEIIISNHGAEFIEAYEKQDEFHAPMLRGNHAASMDSLQQLIDKGLVDRNKIITIVNEAYKPNLKAISYSLTDDKKEITIYSYAGIGLNTIKLLAKKFQRPYKDRTATELARTIDEINNEFQKYVKENKVHTLYTREAMFAGYMDTDDLSKSPFEFIMWNRKCDGIERPAIHNNYHINFAHGHTSWRSTHNNIYPLNSTLGKDKNDFIGSYIALSYCNTKPVPDFESMQEEEIPAGISVLQEDEMEPAEKTELTLLTAEELKLYFATQLIELEIKAYDLIKRGYTKEAIIAYRLCKNLKDNHSKLQNEKIDIETFRTDSIAAINKTRPILENHHRGYKRLLSNIALAVIGLGVIYVAAGIIHKAFTGNFLFFNKTDSGKKLDNLQKSIQSLPNRIKRPLDSTDEEFSSNFSEHSGHTTMI